MSNLKIGFKRLSENAVLPTKAHENDSGFDIYAAADVIIAPGETKVVPTDIAIVLPEGFDAYIKNRSGVASKTKLRVVSPPIDEGYRGTVGIIVDNITTLNYEYDYVDRVVVPQERGYYQLLDGTDERNQFDAIIAGTYKIRKGDRLAQLVVQPRPNTIAVEITGELDETARNGKGFGSSGV